LVRHGHRSLLAIGVGAALHGEGVSKRQAGANGGNKARSVEWLRRLGRLGRMTVARPRNGASVLGLATSASIARASSSSPASTRRRRALGFDRCRMLLRRSPIRPPGGSGRIAGFRRSSYTLGMKTAISLPDQVFAQADRLARRLHKSRSELYREAVAEFIARHEPDAITEAMDRVAEEIETRLDVFSAAAATQVLERTEW